MTARKLAFSIPEACKEVSICRTNMYAEIKAGRLKTVKLGRRTLIRASDLEAWLDSLEEPSAA